MSASLFWAEQKPGPGRIENPPYKKYVFLLVLKKIFALTYKV